MKKLSVANKVLLVLNILSAVAILLSYLAARYSPSDYWALAFFGLGYPVLLLVNLLFCIYWGMLLRPQFFISFVCIVIGFRTFDNFYHVRLFSNKKTEKELAESPDSAYKIMSYNARLFDLYNWTENTKTRDRIFDMLTEEAPAIVCFQEFYYEDSTGFITLDTLQMLTKTLNYHVEVTKTVKKKNHFGIATFTRFPIINRGKLAFGKTADNMCIYTDMVIGFDTVRVYNMHLQSIRLHRQDYRVLDSFLKENAEDTINEVQGAQTIVGRMRKAWARRAWQAEVIAMHIQNCPYKVLLCGDFNDPPTSYTYTTISKGLFDAFKINSSGLGQTYIGRFPSFRIDYILHSKDVKTADFDIITRELSDHYPITCMFKVR